MINHPSTLLVQHTDMILRAMLERTTAGGHDADSNRRRSDLLSFLPGEQLVTDYEVDNGQQQSARPPSSALSDLMDALVPAWPKDGRMSPQREQQQQDHQPLRHSLLIAPEFPMTARISASFKESNVQQEQLQQHQPRVESAPKNRRKSVRFKSPDETFHDQAQGASTSLAAHLSSPDPLSSALPLRNSATSTPKAATASAATSTKPSNRLQRARRASRGGRRLTVALGLVEKGELNDDDDNNNNNYKISYPDLTTKAPHDSPYASVSQQESSSAIAVLQASEDSDTIAVAPRKSTRKRALKDFRDVEVGYPKKKSAK